MRNYSRRTHQLCVVFFSLFISVSTTIEAEEGVLKVVTSFSILEDLVSELGGKRVEVVNLVGRNADGHLYRPKPSDAIAVGKAELVVFNGLGFEGWIARLIENSGFKGEQLIASAGVHTIHLGEELDPHAWQSFRNIKIYVENITKNLIAHRPEYKNEFLAHKKKYLSQLGEIENSLIKQLKAIPESKRIVVTSHDAFEYLGREFGIAFLAPLGPNLDSEATAADVAEVIDEIRERKVTALFLENINNPRLLERIADEAGVSIGGRLYSDALSEEDGPANTYLKMMHYNLESLIHAFSQ